MGRPGWANWKAIPSGTAVWAAGEPSAAPILISQPAESRPSTSESPSTNGTVMTVARRWCCRLAGPSLLASPAARSTSSSNTTTPRPPRRNAAAPTCGAAAIRIGPKVGVGEGCSAFAGSGVGASAVGAGADGACGAGAGRADAAVGAAGVVGAGADGCVLATDWGGSGSGGGAGADAGATGATGAGWAVAGRVSARPASWPGGGSRMSITRTDPAFTHLRRAPGTTVSVARRPALAKPRTLRGSGSGVPSWVSADSFISTLDPCWRTLTRAGVGSCTMSRPEVGWSAIVTGARSACADAAASIAKAARAFLMVCVLPRAHRAVARRSTCCANPRAAQ